MRQSGMFEPKLRELEEQYDRMMGRLRLCQTADRETLRRTQEQIWEEYLENERRLRRVTEDGRSPAVSALSGAQLIYSRRVRRILREDLLERLRGETGTPAEDRLEAAGLYGECAVDLAVQSIRYALLAVMSAMEAELQVEEEKEEETDT